MTLEPTKSHMPIELGKILDGSPDAILLIEPSGGIAYANATIESLSGYTADEIIGAPIEVLVPEARRDMHRSHRREYERAPRARSMGPDLELFLRRADGRLVPVDISLAPFSSGGAQLVIAVVRDATERRRAERDRGELIARLERTRERERIAGDLHDDLIQSVYAVGLDLQAARADARISKDGAIERAVDELKSVIADLRAYMDYLRGDADADEPDGPGEVTVTRLRSLLRSYGSGPRWHTEFQVEQSLSGRHGREIFLMAKELVSNATRHSGATEAWIGIHGTIDGLQLRVDDNGNGFDPAHVRDGAFGLDNLRQRVMALGGALTIESVPGAGTTVIVLVPTD